MTKCNTNSKPDTMPFTRDVVKYLIPKFAKGRAIDIGAGTAKYEDFIVKHVNKYETSDIQELPNIDYVEDATDLSFKDNTFDTVLSFETLEHVYDPESMVSEIYRCLKDEGVCILTVPFLIQQHSDPNDFQRYTVDGLKSLFKRHNFNILEADFHGSTFTVLQEFIKFNFLDPYGGPHSRLRKAIIRRITNFLYFLDEKGVCQSDKIYVNSYIVAKK